MAKMVAESKALNAEVFLRSPHLMRPIASWIEIAGEDYARNLIGWVSLLLRVSLA
jgi:hypothetical protein